MLTLGPWSPHLAERRVRRVVQRMGLVGRREAAQPVEGARLRVYVRRAHDDMVWTAGQRVAPQHHPHVVRPRVHRAVVDVEGGVGPGSQPRLSVGGRLAMHHAHLRACDGEREQTCMGTGMGTRVGGRGHGLEHGHAHAGGKGHVHGRTLIDWRMHGAWGMCMGAP